MTLISPSPSRGGDRSGDYIYYPVTPLNPSPSKGGKFERGLQLSGMTNSFRHHRASPGGP